MKKRVFVSAFGVVLIMLAVVFSGCDTQTPTFSVDRNETAVNVGGNAVLTVTASDTVTAVSRDEDIATVEVGTDNNVTVTGVAAGETAVIITSGSGMVKRVTVTAEDLVGGTKKTMYVAYSVGMTFNAIGTDGATTTVTAASSDETVLTVTAATDKPYITLTPVAAGTSNLTITSASGGAAVTIEVTVKDEIACQGVWTSNWDEVYTITANSITYDDGWGGGYTADIVSHVNGDLNAGDTKITSGASSDAARPGYAVIEYTVVDGPGTGTVGEFNVFRWSNSSDTDGYYWTMTQGYKNRGGEYPDNENDTFATAAAAETGATNAAGYFGGGSPVSR